MTYFGFLLRFLIIPILLLMALTIFDRSRGRNLPASLRLLSPWIAIGVHVVIAVVYTTPWDNYLVATGVWWYNPALVTGITLGWVPLEEYTFFVLQTILTGLWLLWLARRLLLNASFTARKHLRVGTAGIVGLIWITSVIVLISGWKPGNYLSLELAWALLPIMIQLAVGADILWYHRRLVGAVIFTATLYLCLTDSLAIQSGTWTINPELTLGILIGGVLPIEEAMFFLLTNTLLTFGVVLALAKESLSRLPTHASAFKKHYNQRQVQ
jgi:lycopene cyclase domain-containing protein